MKPISYLSNQVESLYIRLRDLLFDESCDAFTKRIVVVPSLAMKRYLMQKLATDKEIGIACGIDFLFLNSAIDLLSGYKSSQFPKSLDLSFRIEHEIKVMKDLKENLGVELLYDHQITALSNRLANLFIEYGATAKQMLKGWEEGQDDHLQAKLWRRIYKDGFSYPYKALAEMPVVKKEGMQVHLFCLSYIQKLHLDFFIRVSEHTPVFMHHLAPTVHFWTDTRSNQESLYLDQYLKKKNIPEGERKELLSYLMDTNPLLANLGVVGRKFFAAIENADLISFESYQLHHRLGEIAEYQELLTHEIELMDGTFDPSLLQMVQADILLMRNPISKIPLQNDDRSIQIHEASSKFREVEILYDNLLHIIAKGKKEGLEILPEDIVVMAPCIAEYEPYIRALFGSKESLLGMQLLDLKLDKVNKLVQGFGDLLKLGTGRWQVSSLFHLFENPYFQKKFKITPNDIKLLQKWAKELNIRWGYDAKHRLDFLTDLYGEMSNAGSDNTWESAITKLILSLSTGSDYTIGFTQAEELTRWVTIFCLLKERLSPLFNKEKKKLREWSEYFEQLLEEFFDIDTEDEIDFLLKCFARISKAAVFQTDINASFAYSSLESQLEAMFVEESATLNENKISAVRFCSLLPMRAIPAKVVALMGLHSEAFPRKTQPSSLDLRKGRSDVDYTPASADFDRYLFLEALLSARQNLILSYCCEDSDHMASSVITELAGYIEKAFSNSPVNLIKKHPIDAFHQSYFHPDEVSFPSYSKRNFSLAQSFYKPSKEVKKGFFNDNKGSIKEIDADLIIDISDLNTLVSRPLKNYLKTRLGLHIDHQEDEIVDEENLFLSPLLMHEIKRASLKRPLDIILKQIEARGFLPPGSFRSISKDRIAQEIEKIEAHLASQNIEKGEISSFYLKDKCKKPHLFADGTLHHPSLQINVDGKVVHIVGKVEDVARGSLISLKKESLKDLIKEWPKFLALNLIENAHEKNLILCSEGKVKDRFFDDPMHHMQSLIRYYFLSKNQPSLLFPEWVDPIIQSSPEKLERAIVTSLGSRIGRSYDPFLHWAFKDAAPCSSKIIDDWQGVAKDVFGPVREGWC